LNDHHGSRLQFPASQKHSLPTSRVCNPTHCRFYSIFIENPTIQIFPIHNNAPNLHFANRDMHKVLPPFPLGNPIVSRHEARAQTRKGTRKVRFVDEKMVVGVDARRAVERVMDNEWKGLNRGMAGMVEEERRTEGSNA
jgi:hypothetical protein